MMLEVGDTVRIKRDLLDDGDSPLLDTITWIDGYAEAIILDVWNIIPETWNGRTYDLDVEFTSYPRVWGCHMRAISAAVLNKSSISRRLVELYRV